MDRLRVDQSTEVSHDCRAVDTEPLGEFDDRGAGRSLHEEYVDLYSASCGKGRSGEPRGSWLTR